MLVQVIDYSDPEYNACMEVTAETLREIGAGGIPMIYVFNKADLVCDLPFALPAVRDDRIYLSAKNGSGIRELWDLIWQKLQEGTKEVTFLLPYARSSEFGHLKEFTDLISVEYLPEGMRITSRCSEDIRKQYADIIREV